MDTNIALAGLASGMAVLVGAECGRGVHDTPPGYAWQHCHEKYVWTPVGFTTSPHHGLVQCYLALTTTHENNYFQRSCHVPGDTTTHENDFSLPCHQEEG
jgi:hypothetical protein